MELLAAEPTALAPAGPAMAAIGLGEGRTPTAMPNFPLPSSRGSSSGTIGKPCDAAPAGIALALAAGTVPGRVDCGTAGEARSAGGGPSSSICSKRVFLPAAAATKPPKARESSKSARCAACSRPIAELGFAGDAELSLLPGPLLPADDHVRKDTVAGRGVARVTGTTSITASSGTSGCGKSRSLGKPLEDATLDGPSPKGECRGARAADDLPCLFSTCAGTGADPSSTSTKTSSSGELDCR